MSDGAWELKGFLDCIDAWVEREDVPVDTAYVATAWVLSRMDDPYEGVRRAQGFENLWFGKVPGTYHSADRTAVVCSYFINELEHEVVCTSFARLGVPF